MPEYIQYILTSLQKPTVTSSSTTNTGNLNRNMTSRKHQDIKEKGFFRPLAIFKKIFTLTEQYKKNLKFDIDPQIFLQFKFSLFW